MVYSFVCTSTIEHPRKGGGGEGEVRFKVRFKGSFYCKQHFYKQDQTEFGKKASKCYVTPRG